MKNEETDWSNITPKEVSKEMLLEIMNKSLAKRVKDLENLVYDFIDAFSFHNEIDNMGIPIRKPENLKLVEDKVKTIRKNIELREEMHVLLDELNKKDEEFFDRNNIKNFMLIAEERWAPRLSVIYKDETNVDIDGFEKIIDFCNSIINI